MRARLREGLLVATLAVLTCAGRAVAGPILDIAPQYQSGHRESNVYGFPYAWDYAYQISFTNEELLAQVRIQLLGYDPGQALRNIWEHGVESAWSYQYDILDGRYRYPILLDLAWVTYAPDEIVTVHAGSGFEDMLNWYTDQPSGWPNTYRGRLAAHEIGHMLGLYDEYVPGAVDPNPVTRVIARNALMADLGPVQERHYSGMLSWLEGASSRQLALAPAMPIPEPSTAALIAMGVMGLWIGRRTRSGAGCSSIDTSRDSRR